MINWTKLEMHNAADNRMPDAEERIAALTEWRTRGSILEWTFGRMGGAHERDDDASTWGPETASDVDWSGFDSTAAYRVIVGEKGNEQGHVIPCEPDASEQDARNHLQGELRAYGSDGWGRVEVQYPGETGWRRLGE